MPTTPAFGLPGNSQRGRQNAEGCQIVTIKMILIVATIVLIVIVIIVIVIKTITRIIAIKKMINKKCG